MKKVLTIDTKNWEISPYVPQSNGEISSAAAPDGSDAACWYIDSRRGRWTTLNGQFSDITQGDEIQLLFWAAYTKQPSAFQVEIMHRDYEKRATYLLLKSTPHFVGRNGKYALYRICHTAAESDVLTIGFSVNGCEMTVFPATEADAERFAATEKGILANLHPVLSQERGEAYCFDGCMAYLAECLGLDSSMYDFHFFAMATGDLFTQVRLDNPNGCTDCLSDVQPYDETARVAFSAIGYRYEFWASARIHAQQAEAFARIKESIDSNLPVILAGFSAELESEFCLIVGYTEDGALKLLMKTRTEPLVRQGLLSTARGLIFAGECYAEDTLKQAYSTCVRSIARCVSRPAAYGCTFGAEAFRAWADSLTDGSLAAAKQVNPWCSYAYQFQMAYANSCAGTRLQQDVLKNCPELRENRIYSVLEKVCAQFDVQNEICKTLLAEGYGFDLTEAQLRDSGFMRSAAEKIRQLCGTCDEIRALFHDPALQDDGFWDTADYRIVKCYKQPLPPLCFVGKCYRNSDRVDGMFSFHWEKWHENNWFAPLEAQLTDAFRAAYPDADAYVGLMKNRYGADESYFEYWIGMFLPANCAVPEGYACVELGYDCAGICWLRGQEWNVYCHENDCYNKLLASGMAVSPAADGGCYFFERYGCPRFTTPDAYGEVTLDIGYFVERENRVQNISALKATPEGEPDKLEYFQLPDARVIGKGFRCPLDKSGANPIPGFWDSFQEAGLFEAVRPLPKLVPAMLGFTDDYDPQTNTFLYICSVLCPAGTPVPAGCISRDIPATIVCKSRYCDWLGDCAPAWENDGYAWSDAAGQCWNAELYLDGEDNDRGFRLLCAVKPK